MSRSELASPSTPRALGYSLPAEWEPHEATWLAWPYDPVTFPDRVERVEERYVEVLRALLPGERVELLVRDEATRLRVQRRLDDLGAHASRLRFHVWDYADVWIRDYAPLFVRRGPGGELAMSKWTFNAWGGKYEGHRRDSGIPYRMNEALRLPLFESGHVLEGGSIDVNGAGTLLTTEQCLLHPNRNAGAPKAEVEGWLRENLGVQQVLWLRRGIEGDDTDGHVDDLARFVSPTTVVCASGEEETGENREVLAENLAILEAAKDQDGRPLRVVPLPMPGPLGDDEGRLPASYANFYIGNRVVLVPTFGDRNDAKALKVLAEQFPGREVVGIRCEDMVYGLGTLHCASMQQPRAPGPSAAGSPGP